MADKRDTYTNADQWRRNAMQRPAAIGADESMRRQAIAEAHNRQEGTTDADILADQQLYIQGKMDIEEYQEYLLFKHSQQQAGKPKQS